MERMNSQPGSMIPGAAHGLLDLRGSMHMHHLQRRAPFEHYHQQQLNQADPQDAMAHTQMHDAVRLPSPKSMQECTWLQLAFPVMDYNKRSDEDDRSLNIGDGTESTDGYDDSGKGNKTSSWLRMKWTDGMIRLLINAVSYLDEDALHDCLRKRLKPATVSKNGKWKSIARVMAERGCCMSPQQCEDKFNDLNRRYKRLTDILGRGTSCKVVENPLLLDLMDHLTNKAKDEKSLHSALRSGDDHELMRISQDVRGGEQGGGTNDLEDDVEEKSALHRGSSSFQKRIRLVVDSDQMALGKSLDKCCRFPHLLQELNIYLSF